MVADFDTRAKHFDSECILYKGPFKYYVIKEVGGWGQKMTIFDDLQCCTVLKINGPLVDKK